MANNMFNELNQNELLEIDGGITKEKKLWFGAACGVVGTICALAGGPVGVGVAYAMIGLTALQTIDF